MVGIFALIGFHLFAYRTPINPLTSSLDYENGYSYPISYDSVYDSFILTFLIFYNEEWDLLMFQQYLGSGALFVIFSLSTLCIGLLFLSKYFMALLLK